MTDYTELVKALRILQEKNSLSYYKRQVCKDAADAIEALEKQIDSIENDKTNLEADIINLEIALDKVNTQLPKRGEWISDRLVTTNGGTYGVRRCSACEAYYQDVGYGWNYCPNCGAKMEVRDADK